MRETKFTKGAWITNKKYKTSINAGKKHVAMVNFFNSIEEETRVGEEEHNANVALIKSAPKMYFALLDIRNVLQKDKKFKREVNKINKILIKASNYR